MKSRFHLLFWVIVFFSYKGQGQRSNLTQYQPLFNESLEDEPEKVNTDPYGDGWMIKIKVSDTSQLDDLLSADDYNSLVGA